jgi:hypothetical protein
MGHVQISDVKFVHLDPPEFGNPGIPSDGYKRLADVISSVKQEQCALAVGQLGCFETVQKPSAAFTPVEDFAVGRGASKQGVFFGKLAVGSERHIPIPVYVAVKPYDKRKADLGSRPPIAVAHDIAASGHLTRISQGSAYSPLGIYRGRDTFPVPHLITQFEERSTSLDNFFKQEETSTDAAGADRQILHAMRLGNFGLGLLHGARITHGDAFPQNFGVDGSRVVLNDTTTFRPFSKKEGQVRARVAEDVSDFVSGIFHPRGSTLFARTLSASVLRHPSVLPELTRAYTSGIALSLRRLQEKQPPVGVLTPDEHTRLIREVAARYI